MLSLGGLAFHQVKRKLVIEVLLEFCPRPAYILVNRGNCHEKLHLWCKDFDIKVRELPDKQCLAQRQTEAYKNYRGSRSSRIEADKINFSRECAKKIPARQNGCRAGISMHLSCLLRIYQEAGTKPFVARNFLISSSISPTLPEPPSPVPVAPPVEMDSDVGPAAEAVLALTAAEAEVDFC